MKDTKEFIEEIIPQMDSPEKVYKLFDGLGYKTLDPSFKGKEAFGLREKDKESVKEIYTIANYQKRFQIFLAELKYSTPAIIRNLPLYFEKETQYPFFVITSDYQNYIFVLVEKIREDVGVWKRKLIKLSLDRENAYYTDKLVLSEIAIEDVLQDPIKIYNNLVQSFSVEKVTKEFFSGYITLFKELENYFFNEIRDTNWAHDYSLQLLNRIMFLYFVQKKRWLDNNPRFITDFWLNYKKEGKEEDSFYERWLSVLFFEAFNNKFFPRPYLSRDLNAALALAPYLNGGLFTPNRLDERRFKVSDTIFERIFTFFDKYNFTIREELPLEVEVAVDPEMIGKVYESLVNISEEADERGEAGIFFTARTEIDFMCRRSIAEYLCNYLDAKLKPLIYEFVFARTDEQKRVVDAKISQYKLWGRIEDLLDDLTVIDLACGSGSFLVGMLNILADLYKRTYTHLNREMSDFDIKKSIIGRSLYGVDVMDWAVHVAELRLWLQLIVETELKIEQLKIQPLLPNLSFKIRPGDSLVQEIGGINLAVRTMSSDISASLKKRLTNLKNEKLKFYNNDPSRRYRTESMLLQEEMSIFRAILGNKALNIENRIKSLRNILREPPQQIKLFEKEMKEAQAALFDPKEALKSEIEDLSVELENIRETQLALKGIQDKPFVWDIDFAEIFSDDKRGFDIAIGNPPYVRQERIAPPHLPREKVTNEIKKLYKDKLEASVRAHFEGRLPRKLDRRSDLYIYFYFHGLSLLNPKGTFCFITSNSWLDVGYGKNLQQFLLENVHIKAIYDNSAKRSFTQADINTIIAVFSAPFRQKGDGLIYSARFAVFKKPFEDVITAENLIEIESVEDNLNTDSYRVISIPQKKLLEEGWEYPENITEEHKKAFRFSVGKYSGNKWGGKYLRAPDIFFTILEKGKGKLVRLGDIAQVRRGFTTGCNEFFYLPSKHFDIAKEGEFYKLIPKQEGLPEDLRIEEEYLPASILSPRDVESLSINTSALPKRLLLLRAEDRLSAGLTSYIQWGERMQFNKRPSCRTRERWWAFASRLPCPLACNYLVNDYMRFYMSKDGLWVSDNFQEIRASENPFILAIVLNGVIIQLFVNMMGRSSFGGGLLKVQTYEVADLLTLLPSLVYLSENQLNEILMRFSANCNKSLYEQFGINPRQPIRSQKPNPLPDRKALDDVVFDILGLTQAERDEVYWAVCELVRNRLEKAKSV